MVRIFIYGEDSNEGSVYGQPWTNYSRNVLVPRLRVTSLSFESVKSAEIPAVPVEMRTTSLLVIFYAEAITLYR